MKMNFVAALPSRRAKLNGSSAAAVWGYALVLFVGGSLFTILATGSYRLVPAVLAATMLGGIVATVKVLLNRP